MGVQRGDRLPGAALAEGGPRRVTPRAPAEATRQFFGAF